jgi:hypothetical protein
VLLPLIFLANTSSSRYAFYYYPASWNSSLRMVLVILFIIYETYCAFTVASSLSFYAVLSLTYIHITRRKLDMLRYLIHLFDCFSNPNPNPNFHGL